METLNQNEQQPQSQNEAAEPNLFTETEAQQQPQSQNEAEEVPETKNPEKSETSPSEKPRKTNAFKAKLERIERKAKNLPPIPYDDKAIDEDDNAEKKSLMRHEKILSEAESKILEYEKKIQDIDEKVDFKIIMREAQKELPKLFLKYKNFDSEYPLPNPKDFENGDEYKKLVLNREVLKKNLAVKVLQYDRLINPQFYGSDGMPITNEQIASQSEESQESREEFEAEVSRMAKFIPQIKNTAKIFDSMSKSQRDAIMNVPDGMRSLVAHCFGSTFTPEQIKGMPYAEFKANFKAALDFCYMQRANSMTQKTNGNELSEVKAPPKIAESSSTPKKETFKEKLDRIQRQGSYVP
jgi:hypothetical protein